MNLHTEITEDTYFISIVTSTLLSNMWKCMSFSDDNEILTNIQNSSLYNEVGITDLVTGSLVPSDNW